MAIYREDIANVELSSGTVYRSFMNHTIGSGDERANRFGVRVFRNGIAENIGGDCSGYFIRADGETVVISDGVVINNKAYVTLPESCYAVEGQFSLAIKCEGGGVTGTLRIVDGVVSKTSTDVIVDPGNVIPSIEALIDAINQAEASIPDDYSALSAMVGSLPANVNYFQKHQGNLSDNGTWNNINDNYQHFVFPVSGGEHLVITTTGRANVGFVKSYNVPVDGETIDYSDATGFTGKIEFQTVGSQAFDIPSDVRYVIVENTYGGTEYPLAGFTLNGYRYAKNEIENIPVYRGTLQDRGITSFGSITEYGYYTFPQAYVASITDAPDGMVGGIVEYFPNFANGANCKIIIDANGIVWFMLGTNTPIRIDGNPDRSMLYNGSMGVIGLTAFSQATDIGYYGFTAASLADITDKPDGLTRGGIVQVFNNAASAQRIQIITDLDGSQWFRYGSNAFVRIGGGVRDVMWYAMGDSITQGYTGSGGNIGPVTTDNYVKNVALLNGYTFVNYGEGGAGYLHNATVGSQKNAKGKAGDIDFSGCDIVTLAYGVNDWHYSQQIGSVSDSKDLGTTMCSNMKWVIEKILTDNPMCKIIVMTPLNCSKYGGDFSTNWGLGYSLATSGTLQNVVDAIISVCEYYGIEYIDQSKVSICNRFNINECLGDGIHPYAAFYPKMAKDLAAKINIK